MVTVGVLALQGGVREHQELIESLGARAIAVKKESQLHDLDALIIPGGESTTISKLIDAFDLKQPIAALIASNIPVLATCAGLILLAEEVDGKTGFFKNLPIKVTRNAYGAQLASAEAVVDYEDGSENAAFIRAPKILDFGKSEVIGRVANEVVAIKFGNIIGASYHPELTNSTMLHRKLLELTASN